MNFSNSTSGAARWGKQNKNFMTPEQVSVTKLQDGLFAEISKGEDFNHNIIYGLSLLKYNSVEKTFDTTDGEEYFGNKANGIFYSYDKVQDRITELKELLES
jgi:hypothetical protein